MILIKHASEIITLSGSSVRPLAGTKMSNLNVIKNADLLIDSKILKIGKDLKAKDAIEIDAHHRVVMPGFVDPHTHLVFSGTREFEFDLKRLGKSYLEIVQSGGGIHYTVANTKKASKLQLKEEARKRLKNMALYGTTTAEAKSGYGEVYVHEKKILEVIHELNGEMIELVPTFLGAHAIPEDYNAEEYIDYLISIIPKISHLSTFIDVFCDKGAFNVSQSLKYLLAGMNYGLIPKLHADEIAAIGCSQLALKLNAISADHLLKTTFNVIRKFNSANTIAVLMPGTPYMLFSRKYANARNFIKLNVPVALGTDLNPNCYTESMQTIINLAITQMRMSTEEAITAATINAAHALGVADRIGSIEPGKQADIIILDVPSYRHLGYHFGVNLVNDVIKNGKILVKDQKIQYV